MVDSGAQVGMCYRGESRVLLGILGCSPLDYKVSKGSRARFFPAPPPPWSRLYTLPVFTTL